MSQLQAINLVDFTGGLNVRRSQFTLADNESPDMLNIEVDPRLGFYTRNGWQRWNDADIVDMSSSDGDTWTGSVTISGGTATVTTDSDPNGLAVGMKLSVTGTASPEDVIVATATDGGFTYASSLGDEGPTSITYEVIPNTWDPRLSKMHLKSDSSYDVYIATVNEYVGDTGTVWVAPPTAVFTDLGITAGAVPHGADFAAWSDTMYMVCGWQNSSYKRDATPTLSALAGLNGSNWNDEYTAPAGGVMPQAEFCETHAGYMFVANITDHPSGGSAEHRPNRIRWSHPNQPEDWAELDFIDIERGGGRITGLLSFRDHLLIFKTDSVWALYGYSLENWQLVEVSVQVGVPGPQAIAKSESAVYFYSGSDRGGVFAYTGGAPVHISEKLRTVIETITATESVTVGWVARRLWVSVPVSLTRDGVTVDATVFVFDPEVGDGVWVRHATAGSVGPFVERSDVLALYPMAVLRSDANAAAVVELERRTGDALDIILDEYGNFLTDATGGYDIRLVDSETGDFLTDGVAVEGTAFSTYYRTGWKNAGWPELRKSWLRPRYVFRVPEQPVTIRYDAYLDYNDADARRTGIKSLDGGGGATWGGGDDWGDADLFWGIPEAGGTIERTPTNLGLGAAVQLEISSDPTTPGKSWAVDGIVLKYRARRFTT